MEKYMPPYKSNTPLDENLILFASIPDFSSSGLAFWEYIRGNTDFETMWIIKDRGIYDRLIGDGVKCSLWGNYAECAEWFSKAKYVVISDESRHTFPKPEGQIDIQLRSTLILAEDIFTLFPMHDAMLKFANFAKARSTCTDIFSASSPLTRTTAAAANFIDARKICVIGIPRLDSVINADGKAILTGVMPDLKSYNKLVFYCPSAKKGLRVDLGPGFDDNIFNLTDFKQKEFESLLEVNKTAVIFKMHPADEYLFHNRTFSFPKHCYMIDSHTFWPKSLYHVLNAFDVMVTDFSSLAYEFLLLDRPIVFNHAAVEALRTTYRSLVDDDFLFPGRIFNTSGGFFEALQAAIDNPMEYHEQRMKTQKLLHTYTDGKSCKRLFELMKHFTPIENIDYEMFTRSLREEKDREMSSISAHYDKHYKLQEQEIAALQNQHNLQQKEMAALAVHYDDQYKCQEREIAALQNQSAQLTGRLDTAQHDLVAVQEENARLNSTKSVKFARMLAKIIQTAGRVCGKIADFLSGTSK